MRGLYVIYGKAELFFYLYICVFKKLIIDVNF